MHVVRGNSAGRGVLWSLPKGLLAEWGTPRIMVCSSNWPPKWVYGKLRGAWRTAT